ncbi:MAG: rRNA pseudouridine synthase [Planctomycetaceae bacterium]|nr:rRNA pseudouridine synthase [Planctomycetaceae bacterium]
MRKKVVSRSKIGFGKKTAKRNTKKRTQSFHVPLKSKRNGSGSANSPADSDRSSLKPSFRHKKTTRKRSAKFKAVPERPNRRHLFASDTASKKESVVAVRINGNLPHPQKTQKGYRLQKVLAAAGFGSRRECEELITSGRVEVDRKPVTELGVRVSPTTQEIRVDGETLKKTKPVYLAVYKPKGYVCSHWDPEHRLRAIDLVPEKLGRLFSIGRLDLESEGLLLMTNDGALTERLTHPKYEVPKRYKVQVAGLVDHTIVAQLKKGAYFAEGHAQASNVVVKGTHKNSSILEIELKEGKNREIRRLLARLGHKVMALQRISVGSVRLGKMLPGEYRPLTSDEVDALYAASVCDRPLKNDRPPKKHRREKNS